MKKAFLKIRNGQKQIPCGKKMIEGNESRLHKPERKIVFRLILKVRGVELWSGSYIYWNTYMVVHAMYYDKYSAFIAYIGMCAGNIISLLPNPECLRISSLSWRMY